MSMLFGLIFLCIGLRALYFRIRAFAWRQVAGEIVESTFGKRQEPKSFLKGPLVYIFEVDGHTYMGTNRSPGGVDFSIFFSYSRRYGGYLKQVALRRWLKCLCLV